MEDSLDFRSYTQRAVAKQEEGDLGFKKRNPVGKEGTYLPRFDDQLID